MELTDNNDYKFYITLFSVVDSVKNNVIRMNMSKKEFETYDKKKTLIFCTKC